MLILSEAFIIVYNFYLNFFVVFFKFDINMTKKKNILELFLC